MEYFKEKMLQILPIFNAKYCLPFTDSDNQDGIMAQYQHAIRLQFFETSKQNDQEEVFINMRSYFDMLLGIFIQKSQLG